MKKDEKIHTHTVQSEKPLNRSDVFMTKRPEKMSFKDYKEIRAHRNRVLKHYLKYGTLLYCAAEIVDVNDHITGKVLDQKYITHPPFKGSVRDTFLNPKKAES